VYDAVVIGVGTMGAAACDALARRGARVLGLEQFDIPHGQGSHHGQSRMFRMSYYEHPDYVPLLKRAFEMWQELERRAGVKLFHVTGGVYLGAEGGELVSGSLESARRHGLAHEALERRAVEGRWPQFRVREGWAGFFEPTAGFVVPELAVGTMAAQALAAGAEVRGREAVRGWERRGEVWEVRTDAATYAGRRLIVTCGAWTSRMVRELGVELVVTRQVLGWVAPARVGEFALGRFPCWAAECEGGVHYGFPVLPWHPGLKMARHARGARTEPEAINRRITAADEADFRGALAHLRDADGPTLSALTCLYTNSPDSHFVIDRHPREDGVVLACGFSGHGFKFAPVIGEVLAELALDGKSRYSVGFLGLGRFGRAV
jgi:sarcosine oxidase